MVMPLIVLQMPFALLKILCVSQSLIHLSLELVFELKYLSGILSSNLLWNKYYFTLKW